MADGLENPVLKQGEGEGINLRDMAEKVDLGQDVPELDSSANEPAPRAAAEQEDSKPKIEPDNTETPAATEQGKEQQGRDEKGRFQAKQPEQPQSEQEQKGSESKFERAKKDAERKDKSWKALNEEKVRFQAESERLRQEREAFERYRQNPPQPQPDKQGFTAKQYSEAAADFQRKAKESADNGDEAEAAKNWQLALRAQEAARQAEQGEIEAQTQSRNQVVVKNWEEGKQKVLKEHPEILEENSPIAKTMWDWLNPEAPTFQRIFHLLPNGFADCYQIAQWKTQAEAADARVSGLSEENKKLKADLAKFHDLTAIGGDHPTNPAPAKRFDDMSLDEMGKALRRAAEGRAIAA